MSRQDYVRKPEWLKIRLNTTKEFKEVQEAVQGNRLHSVCEEAACPNRHECWGEHKTATFMILGEICTRRCRFCNVKTGLPPAPDPAEPLRVAESVRDLELRHAVITMVTRDDLTDGGAQAVAETVLKIRELNPACSVEVLTSDMMGNPEAIRTICDSKPAVNSHNMETVRRLTPQIRSRSDYDRSLSYLRIAKELDPASITKSSLMLGLGETRDEILQTMDDLRAVDVDMLNMGQYLQPTRTHAPVKYYWTPEEFAELKEEALDRGFLHCESAPLVRSSYHAGQQFDDLLAYIRASRG